MIDSVTTCPARYTKVAANRWSKGSLFAPEESQEDAKGTLRFRWAPDLADVHRSAEVSEAGEDLWCSLNESISVTPLKADFAVAPTQGEAPQGLLMRAVLDEDASVDETLVEGALLEARVDNVICASGLLEDTDVVLALTGKVRREGALAGGSQGLVALGVEDTDGAAKKV
ncbi:hypothetical protein HYQ46_007896 [Verticillium longisporum]|nr:hypothetical protein HYQ46_007896 [Verticillium longisporum]